MLSTGDEIVARRILGPRRADQIESLMKLIVICEAPADFQLASCLIVRSLRHHGPQWFEDLPVVADFRGWSDSSRTDHALWKEIDGVYDRKGGRPCLGAGEGLIQSPPPRRSCSP